MPITTNSGKLIYLEDIADVYYSSESMGGISRYNGEETISISISKNQDVTAMKLSSQVNEAVKTLMADDEDLSIDIVRDEADDILSSLKDVATTMVLAIGISMIVLYLFFGYRHLYSLHL